MLNVGGGEILVIALVALIVLGPERLPGAIRQVGRVLGEFKKVTTSFEREMRSALSDLDDETIEAEARRRGLALTEAEAAAAATAEQSINAPEGEPASTDYVPVTEPEALELTESEALEAAEDLEPSDRPVDDERSSTVAVPHESPIADPTPEDGPEHVPAG
jgi:sec-independent protein translocase protein TatB